MKFRYEKLPVLVPQPMPTWSLGLFGRYRQLVLGVRKWRLASPFHFWLDHEKFVIPKGFEFDGASLPKGAFSFVLFLILSACIYFLSLPSYLYAIVFFLVGVLLLLSPVGLMLVQGLVHDFGYRYDYLIESKRGLPRRFCGAGQRHWDRVFLASGLAVNGFPVVNYASYAVLRAVGWVAFNGHRRRETRVAA